MSSCGTGKPVLLLHGYMSCKESFFYQFAALKRAGYRVVAPDFPGFGGSAPLRSPWSVGDYADWLKDFMEECGLRGANIIAHSFGARVTFKLLSREGALADKVVITGGAGLVKPRSPQYIRQVKRYRLVKKFFPRYAERHFGSEEYRALSPLMKESYKKIVNEDLLPCVRAIRNRILFIYGESDAVTPANEEGITFSREAGGNLKIIKGGHFCFSENAENFNALALGFFAEDG